MITRQTWEIMKDYSCDDSTSWIRVDDFLSWIKNKKDLATTMNDEKAIYILILDFLKELK